MGEGQSVGRASALEVVGTLTATNPADSASPLGHPDGGLPSTAGGSGGERLADAANGQPWVGWGGSGDKEDFEMQGGAAGQKEGG